MHFDIQHIGVDQKLAKIMVLALVWFDMGLDQMAYMATIEFQSSNAYFLYPTCHNRPIIIQSHGFGLDMFFGADCQVGIEFSQLLGQDWDWD